MFNQALLVIPLVKSSYLERWIYQHGLIPAPVPLPDFTVFGQGKFPVVAQQHIDTVSKGNQGDIDRTDTIT